MGGEAFVSMVVGRFGNKTDEAIRRSLIRTMVMSKQDGYDDSAKVERSGGS